MLYTFSISIISMPKKIIGLIINNNNNNKVAIIAAIQLCSFIIVYTILIK